MAVERKVEAEWFGGLIDGSGSLGSSGSGVIPNAELTWMGREDENEGYTNPEELLAAAHAADFVMTLTAGFVGAGLEPEELYASATITKETGGGGIIESVLSVTGTVEGATDEQWRSIANRAKALCPITLALAGVDVRLELPDIADEPEEEDVEEEDDELDGDQGEGDDEGDDDADDLEEAEDGEA